MNVKDSSLLHLDCLVIGDGCIGLYIAQKIKKAMPTLHVGIKARTPSEPDAVLPKNKHWLKALLHRHGIEYIRDYSALAPRVDKLIVTTKSDDVQQAASELQRAAIHVNSHMLIFNGILAPLMPAFPGQSVRAIPPAGYALDRQADNGLQVVNADKPWPVCGDTDAMQLWVTFLNSIDQQAFADDSAGLRIVRKYLINTAVNPLTVIYQRNVDELLDDTVTYQRMQAILTETIALLRQDDLFADTLAQVPDDEQLLSESFAFIETYRGHYTSAYHAFKAGQRVEVSSLTGYAIALADKLAQACPQNKRVWQQIQHMQLQRDQVS